MIDDLSKIASELVKLIQAEEFEKARQLVWQARRAAATSDLEGRQQNVHALTLAIAEAKRQRARILRELEHHLPDAQGLFSRVQAESLCGRLFDDEIASLTTMKRKLSLPARS